MRKFQVVNITANTPYERGIQYGEAAEEKIKAGIENYKITFAQLSSKDWDYIKSCALAYLPIIEKEMPEILEEAKGIAKGANVDMGDLMVLNCRYELTKYDFFKECTTCAILPEASKGNKTLLVKNWDYRAGILDNILVVKIEEKDGTKIIGLTEAGQLIREGFNSNGIGLCNNSLKSIYDGEGEGIPVTFLRRKVLSSKTFKDAKELLISSKRSVSNNMLLASKNGEAIDIEASPKGCDLIEAEKNIITHANHFIVNEKLNALGSTPRDTRLRELLNKKYGEIDIEYIKKCMSDHANYPKAICRHPSNVDEPLSIRGITVASMIIDFDENTVHICAGPPCESEYIPYKF